MAFAPGTQPPRSIAELKSVSAKVTLPGKPAVLAKAMKTPGVEARRLFLDAPEWMGHHDRRVFPAKSEALILRIEPLVSNVLSPSTS